MRNVLPRRTGILLHVYHLGSADWEHLVWGEPARNELGTGTKLIEFLLNEPLDAHIRCITYSGPSSRDGLSEGAYTKQFLISHLDRLREFPRFREMLRQLPPEASAVLRTRMEQMVLGEQIENTLEEVQHAAVFFQEHGVDHVVHIAAASHAPRCIQLQAVVRHQGLIPLEQQWFTVASDSCFEGTVPSDVVVVEPPHRGDDPLLGFAPTLSRALKPYFGLPPEEKQAVIWQIDAAVSDAVKRRKASSSRLPL